jgi:hypothetical protein
MEFSVSEGGVLCHVFRQRADICGFQLRSGDNIRKLDHSAHIFAYAWLLLQTFHWPLCSFVSNINPLLQHNAPITLHMQQLFSLYFYKYLQYGNMYNFGFLGWVSNSFVTFQSPAASQESNQYTFTLKTATAVIAEMLSNFQHSSQLIPRRPKLYTKLQPRKSKIKAIEKCPKWKS